MDRDQLIAELRRRANLATQRTLAEQLKISPQYLSDILCGYRAPGPLVLKALGLREVVTYERVR